ncbi:MAG: opacity protein-like surface antigen [Saprospiraceae bacterium]|jgi:opacity protein-like surface antigen
MKNFLLLTFLFLTTTVFAQKNEVVISYLPLHIDAFGNGASLGYYRNLSGKNALGIKTSFNRLGENDYDYSKNFSFDVVNRWNLSKANRFRFMTEIGVTALRRYQPVQNHNIGWCGNSTPQEINRMLAMYEGQKTNYFGFVSSLGFDFRVTKNISFGAGYLLKAYFTNNTGHYNAVNYLTNLSINTSMKF